MCRSFLHRFNPDYKKYGWAGWPGGLAEDVYHPGQYEPYTGGTKIDDYVEDVQQEQMRILTRDYKVDILWCGKSRVRDLVANESLG